MTDALDIEITPGDFVVVQTSWNYSVVQATKVTPLCYWAAPSWDPNRQRKQLRSNVIFACRDESVARRLFDQLTSSAALCDQEKTKAAERRAARDKSYIEQAEAAAQQPLPSALPPAPGEL